MYVIELALRMSPVPVSVQRKEHGDAEALYQQIHQALESGQPRLLELTCEKVEGKKVTLLISEILAVQLYEKASATGGSKRSGCSLDGSTVDSGTAHRPAESSVAQRRDRP